MTDRPPPAERRGGGIAREPSRAARRLTLSPIGLDIVLAVGQAPEGLRLAELAHAIGSPVSSTQTALRILVANALVERTPGDPPRYRLSPDHPARAELASLATVLPEAERAIGIILRANPAVAFAGVDEGGFVVATDDQPPEALAALERDLSRIAEARPGSPSVVRLETAELRRLVRVSLDLRARLRDAIVIKGSATAIAGGPAGRGPRPEAVAGRRAG